MAPVETDAATRSNSLPIALFGGQILLVTGLTAHVLYTARRAAKSLPPSTTTRSQSPVRRTHAVLFSTLAFLALASVTSFAVIWRAISYVAWAEQGNHETPGSLWTGWYGTGNEGVGSWRLGDWILDIDLVKESDAVAVLRPEGFVYTSQLYVGVLASAIFFGVEGRRRNLDPWTIASFVVLSTTGSLGYALSLFFVTMLYTPVTIHSDETPLEDALFTPSPRVYYAPIILTVLSLNYFPTLLEHNGDVRVLRIGYVVMPLLFAFAPQICPLYLGRHHASLSEAHRSYTKVYHFLSMASLFLYWRVFVTNVSNNTPPAPSYVWDVFTNAIGKPRATKPNRLLSGLSTTGQKLKHISGHPAITVTSLDVLFTTLSLLAWTFTRNLDIDAILHSSFLSPLAPKAEKHVTFKDSVKDEQEPHHTGEATPRRRGRPSKKPLAASVNGTSTSSASTTGSMRRSTRRNKASVDLDSDADSVYDASHAPHASRNPTHSEPDTAYRATSATRRDVAETESDGALLPADVIEGGEATALALFLAVAGGMGQIAGGVLGGEVVGS